jgi:hypothetical protein
MFRTGFCTRCKKKFMPFIEITVLIILVYSILTSVYRSGFETENQSVAIVKPILTRFSLKALALDHPINPGDQAAILQSKCTIFHPHE